MSCANCNVGYRRAVTWRHREGKSYKWHTYLLSCLNHMVLSILRCEETWSRRWICVDDMHYSHLRTSITPLSRCLRHLRWNDSFSVQTCKVLLPASKDQLPNLWDVGWHLLPGFWAYFSKFAVFIFVFLEWWMMKKCQDKRFKIHYNRSFISFVSPRASNYIACCYPLLSVCGSSLPLRTPASRGSVVSELR